MNIFLKKLLIISLSIVFILSLLDIFYTWIISEVPLHGIKRNEHVDYLIAGDSRTNPLIPTYLTLITGKKVINIGDPGYTLDDNIRLLKYFFEMGNRVDRVLLQVDWKFGARYAEHVDSKEWRYMPHLMRNEGLLTPRIPFIFYAKNNRNIKPINILKMTRAAIFQTDVIEQFDTTVVLNTHRPYMYNKNLMYDYSKMKFRIKDIIALDTFLKRNGVEELILFSTPYLQEGISTQSNPVAYKHKVMQAGYRFYDFSTVYQDTTWFKDWLHVRNSKYLDFCRRFAAVAMSQPHVQSLPLKP